MISLKGFCHIEHALLALQQFQVGFKKKMFLKLLKSIQILYIFHILTEHICFLGYPIYR